MIETNNLKLRPFKESDAMDVLEYLGNPEVHCFMCMKLDDLNSAREEIKRRMKENYPYFAIVHKETNKVIGEIEAIGEPSNPDENNTTIDTYSPCWMLNPSYKGMGYGYEAAAAFFDYLFYTLNARRIYAYTEDYNIASQRLCLKLGMRLEGEFKDFVTFINNPDGTPLYETTRQYAILKTEWKQRTV